MHQELVSIDVLVGGGKCNPINQHARLLIRKLILYLGHAKSM
jgi:hypothetical protein